MKKNPSLLHEVFRSPEWVHSCLIDKYPEHFSGNKAILDPSAGDGRALEYIIKKQINTANHHFLIDIRPEEKNVWIENPLFNTKISGMIFDFTKFTVRQKFAHTAITNPPFSLAQEFVDKLHECVYDDGWIWILQRLDFLASKSRMEWHKSKKSFARVEVLSKRPTWEIDNKPNNGSDMRDYAWYGYHVGHEYDGPTIGWLERKQK